MFLLPIVQMVTVLRPDRRLKNMVQGMKRIAGDQPAGIDFSKYIIHDVYINNFVLLSFYPELV